MDSKKNVYSKKKANADGTNRTSNPRNTNLDDDPMDNRIVRREKLTNIQVSSRTHLERPYNRSIVFKKNMNVRKVKLELF